MKNKNRHLKCILIILPIIIFMSIPNRVKALEKTVYDCGFSKTEKPSCVNDNTCILLCGYNLKNESYNDSDLLRTAYFYKAMYLYYNIADKKLKIGVSKPGTNNTCVIEEFDSSDPSVRWFESSRTSLLNDGQCPVVLDERNVQDKVFCFEKEDSQEKCQETVSSGSWFQKSYTKEYDIASNSDELKKFKELYGNFQQGGNQETYNKCEDLIGKNLQDKLNEIMNIVKIGIPIMLIVFGILDFGKAILSQDGNAMKKAQNTFIKRIVIGIIIFLVPSFVNLIINLANAVWPSISGETCIK